MLIGLSGKAGSGKNTAGDILADLTGYKTYALASPLKFMINTLFGWDERHAEGELKEVESKYNLSNWKGNLCFLCENVFGEMIKDFSQEELIGDFYRKVLLPYMISENWDNQTVFLQCSPRQIYQKFGTEFARRIHSQMWVELAKIKAEELDYNMIITDVRFDNEAAWIKESKGYNLLIERPGVGEVSSHVSESGFNKEYLDFTINNDSSLEKLEESLSMVVDIYLGPPVVQL